MENKSKNRKYLCYIVVIIILVIALFLEIYFGFIRKEKQAGEKNPINDKVEVDNNPYLNYRIKGNSLDEFDLSFLKLENEKGNKIYSPLSIKYALAMLEEGANGESKKQISNVIGKYSAKKYNNNNNMSFANALFIKDSYRNSIKDDYKNTLLNKYNAEVIYDPFTTADGFNSWISDKTFHLIDKMADDISDEDFILVNALAIDMEWKNKIQSEHNIYQIHYNHENFYHTILSLNINDYSLLDFKGASNKVKSTLIGATVNKYDIVNKLGEDSIRATVGPEYEKWLANKDNWCSGDEPDVNTYLNQYIKELNEGYKQIDSSTDFEFYTDDNVKVFAKDLKEYDGMALQYVGIMPKKDNLEDYIKNSKASDITTLVNKLKSIELDNFKDGVITKITGYIPMFQFDYELKLKENLKKLGITNVFDSSKADLSNLTLDNAFISKVSHKANIEFSNDGIKAGAAIETGGAGAASCGFEYLYEVPVEEIDLTFDKPYLFLVRDKSSGEVWFIGTVYEPITDYVPIPGTS